MTNRRRETAAVTTIECPWCQGPALVTLSAVQCDACNMTVELVPEPTDVALAA